MQEKEIPASLGQYEVKIKSSDLMEMQNSYHILVMNYRQKCEEIEALKKKLVEKG